jgi:hypothetical protein
MLEDQVPYHFDQFIVGDIYILDYNKIFYFFLKQNIIITKKTGLQSSHIFLDVI